jgi:AcrR family transcriptional regulator
LSKRNSGQVSESRERVLDAAEKLFMEHGYDRVSMRDIAALLGVRQAALYYHAPEGKSQLFMMVVERNMERQREGLEAVIAAAPPDLHKQLTAISLWLVDNMPIDMIGMLRSDAAQAGTNGAQLFAHVSRSIMAPILRVVMAAQERGEVRDMEPTSLAGMLIANMNWTALLAHHYPVGRTKEQMIESQISVLLYGATPR